MLWQETREVEPPSPDEVQVSVRSTGLCGSDLHYYNYGRNGDIVMQEPMSLGHESAGIVEAVGANVHSLKVGDKIALEVGQPCGDCSYCNEGRYNICKTMRFRASAKSFPHYQGTLQERINAPAAWCHKLPDSVSLDVGALLEPLGVAMHASRRAQLWRGSTVLVFGAGAVGLLVAAMAKVNRAKEVVIADIDRGRLDFAVQNNFANASFTVPMKRGNSEQEILDIAIATAASITKVKQSSGNEIGEFAATFECTGVPSCTQAAIYATRAGGRVVLVGMGNPVYTLPVSAAALREVDLVGSFRYANTYPECINVVARKDPSLPDFSSLVTHRYQGLDKVAEAFAMAGKTKDDQGRLVLKVVVDTSSES